MTHDQRQWLRDMALALGFDTVGVCSAVPGLPAREAFERWLAAGMHGDMAYMARPDRVRHTLDPRPSPSRAVSLVVVGRSYLARPEPGDALEDPARGRFAAYAWQDDYHQDMGARLRQLGREIQRRTGVAPGRVFVDTGPLLERDAGARAGLGFVGRNTMLVCPGLGSWLFLGALLMAGQLAADPPVGGPGCSRCRRCLCSCPTGALVAPYVLDARRCIAYLTIELRGPIPRALRTLMGNRVFGCDSCNAVCPYNAAAMRRAARVPFDEGRMAPPLSELVALDQPRFEARFGHSAVMRAGREGLLRNACVALGNWGSPEALEPLACAVRDPSALVRAHAAWALGRLGRAGRWPLELAERRERHPWVAGEIRDALADAGRRGEVERSDGSR